jgi:hypothetical protein
LQEHLDNRLPTMSEYYIRTPEQDESRGPFDVSKLLTLAEAGQVTPNTLYYDEEKEEWVPLALNPTLHAQIFPEREKLSLKISHTNEHPEEAAKANEESGLNVEAMLAAAEGQTEEKRKLTRQKKSLERAANISTASLGIMLILSALYMILPHVPAIQQTTSDGSLIGIFNYPVIWIGIFDLLLGMLLMLSVTEVYPLARGRAMLTLGFGLYVGWALGDPLFMLLSVAAGFGIFLATISRGLGSMIPACVLGIGGNGALAFLALNGRFDGFFDSIILRLF